MIAVDASAILAIYLEEDESPAFRAVLEAHGGAISPVNAWEVLSRAHKHNGRAGADHAEALLNALGVQVKSIGADDARVAYEAFARYGKGVGGPLNLGDCFAYALAQAEGDGLLFKGDDFARTDLKPA